MKKLLAAAAIALAALGPGAASAAVIEFDTSLLFMQDVFGGSGLPVYGPTGTFLFDTDTLDVDSVSVSTPYAIYSFGSYDGPTEVISLFGLGGASDPFTLSIKIDFADLVAAIAGLSPGDSFSLFALPFEADLFEDYGLPFDPELTGTVLDPPSVIPLPAGLPLLLAGLAAFGLARRRKT